MDYATQIKIFKDKLSDAVEPARTEAEDSENRIRRVRYYKEQYETAMLQAMTWKSLYDLENKRQGM